MNGPTQRSRIEAIDRLAPIQFGILYGYLGDATKTAYVGQWHCRIEGALDCTALDHAWQFVVARHSILRTAFDWQTKTEPLQIVLRDVVTAVDVTDLSPAVGGDPLLDSRDDRVDACLAADRARGFDISRPPLMRLSVVRLAPSRHVLVWTRHHLVCDGWTLAVLFEELFETYAARLRGQDPILRPAVPFSTYLAWWNSSDHAAARAFWTARLAGIAPLLSPPALSDRRPGAVYQQTHIVDAHATALARAACRKHRVTLNTLFQGAWSLVLSRHRGEDSVVFGATETVRPDNEEDGGVCLGPKINTLPVRIDTWSALPVGEWLRAIQASAVAARHHARLSLPDIASCCGAATGQALFDTILVFQNYPLQGAILPAELGLTMSAVDDVSIPDLPLALIIEPGDTILCRLIVQTNVITAAQAQALLNDLAAAVRALAIADDAPVTDVDIRPDLRPAPCALEPHPAAPARTALHDIADARPDATALVQGGITLSYDSLRQRVARMAAAIVARHGVGKRIGLLCRNSIESIVALLAIQWSGGAYVPLDPSMPPSRLAGMIADAELTAVIVDPAADATAVAALLPDLPLIAFASLDALIEQSECAPYPLLPQVTEANAPAYIIFTSGSTGRPKGVAVSHANLAAIVGARVSVYPEPIGGALLTFPLIFDGSVLVLFATLSRGAPLILPDSGPMMDAGALCRTIARTGVTHTVMVPSLHRALLEAALPGQLDGLVACAVAGEACASDLVRRHYAALPKTRLVNEYGPTETTVWATAHVCLPQESGAQAPIGRAIPGVRVFLLDPHLRPAVPGTVGEIFIGGRGVALGYVGRPGLTAERFLPDPWSQGAGGQMYRTGDLAIARPDDALMFAGRADSQIKLRGYRIEPGEIEAVLRAEPSVGETVVVLHQAPDKPDLLVAYVSGGPEKPAPDADTLRTTLAAKLPAYMVPSLVVLPEFPRLASGKLDRNALPPPREDAVSDHDQAPAPGEEANLAGLWRDILGLDFVPATRDFFDLGGTSLLGMSLVARIRAQLAAPIELHELFRFPTIRALAPLIAARRSGDAATPAPIVRRERQRITTTLPRGGV